MSVHPLHFLLFNILLKVLGKATRQEEEIKWIQIENGKIKGSLFADDMILYLRDTKDSPRKFLDLITIFGKMAGYKIMGVFPR